MSLITLNAVTKSYLLEKRELTVLKGIDLEIDEGEIVCLIGPSGGGKSTLLRSINALESIDSGTIEVCGHRLDEGKNAVKKAREATGMIFQRFELFPHLSALANVKLGLTAVRGLKDSEATEKAEALLRDVGLIEHKDKFPTNLSGGQQQRVAIARALSTEPRVLLCDEPTSALDPELVEEVTDILSRVAASGMTMLVVTHEMNFARKVADRILFLDAGKIAESGPAEAIFNNPQSSRLKQFLNQVEK